MTKGQRTLTPAQAAKRLGVSAKTLRLYEQRGLIAPARSRSGWRHYRPQDMAAAARIIAWRNLGLGLTEIERVARDGDSALDTVLAEHEAAIAGRIRDLQDQAANVRRLRQQRHGDDMPKNAGASNPPLRRAQAVARFALPWPWGGETFDVAQPHALTFIIGPLASGKTRLARCLADALPGGEFVGLERLEDGARIVHAALARDRDLKRRVDVALAGLVEDGALINDALIAIVANLEAGTPAIPIVDLIEQDLPAATQAALSAYLQRRSCTTRPLFVMTRSTSVLDLDRVAPDTGIIFCPPNHSPPMYVTPRAGSPGYEAVRLCLASPEVRRRSAGVIVVHRSAAA